MNIIVLGAGKVGSPMAIDLAKDFDVSVADINEAPLKRLKERFSIRTYTADLSNPENIKALVADYDLVVGAVPGFIGYQTFKSVIESGKDIVDISFFSEDPFTLDNLAQEQNVTAIVDCGVSPGMSNFLVGYVDSLLDKIEDVKIYVGGLPAKEDGLYNYKTVFSLVDVLEIYTRPVSYIENGQEKNCAALSDVEAMRFPEIGILEAFLTDGLRTLTRTIKADNMKEKTLRYPGHIEKIKSLGR